MYSTFCIASPLSFHLPPTTISSTQPPPHNPLHTPSVSTTPLHTHRTFAHTPGPASAVVQCYILRDISAGGKRHPRYTLHLEEGHRFLLSAQRRKGSKSSNYVISTNQVRERGGGVGWKGEGEGCWCAHMVWFCGMGWVSYTYSHAQQQAATYAHPIHTSHTHTSTSTHIPYRRSP